MAITITRPTQSITFHDGVGRNAIVRNASGQHFLISEVHRQFTPARRVDETMVFPCDAEGNVTQWSEVFVGDSIEDALQNFSG